MVVRFDLKRDDAILIHAIVKRVAKGNNVGMLAVDMDLTACHLNGCPLKLRSLLTAGEADFWHDISGISENIDRETGKLRNCFLPRFAR